MDPAHVLNCIVIDDDDIDREAIGLKCMADTRLRVIGKFANALESLELIRSAGNVLVLLDIDMPGINGLDFISLAPSDQAAFILVTSHPEYALASYEQAALDYLLKPVTSQRFQVAITRALEYFDTRNKARLYEMQVNKENVTIRDGYDTVRLNIGDIVYLEALKDYTKVITTGKTYMTSINLKESLAKMPDHRFLRIHRSYAVSIREIRKMEQNELLLDRVRLPVGKTYKQDVSKFLKQGG